MKALTRDEARLIAANIAKLLSIKNKFGIAQSPLPAAVVRRVQAAVHFFDPN